MGPDAVIVLEPKVAKVVAVVFKVGVDPALGLRVAGVEEDAVGQYVAGLDRYAGGGKADVAVPVRVALGEVGGNERQALVATCGRALTGVGAVGVGCVRAKALMANNAAENAKRRRKIKRGIRRPS